MFKESCTICNSRGYVKDDKGYVKDCICVIKDKIYYFLNPFIPFEKKGFNLVKDKAKELVHKKLNKKIPLKVVLKHPKRGSEHSLGKYKNLMIMYLLDTGLHNNYTFLYGSDILELYLSNKLNNDATGFNFYNIKSEVIVVVLGRTGIKNKEEENILRTFIEVHKNKDLFFVVYKKVIDYDDWWRNDKGKMEKTVKTDVKDFKHYKDYVFDRFDFDVYTL